MRTPIIVKAESPITHILTPFLFIPINRIHIHNHIHRHIHIPIHIHILISNEICVRILNACSSVEPELKQMNVCNIW